MASRRITSLSMAACHVLWILIFSNGRLQVVHVSHFLCVFFFFFSVYSLWAGAPRKIEGRWFGSARGARGPPLRFRFEVGFVPIPSPFIASPCSRFGPCVSTCTITFGPKNLFRDPPVFTFVFTGKLRQGKSDARKWKFARRITPLRLISVSDDAIYTSENNKILSVNKHQQLKTNVFQCYLWVLHYLKSIFTCGSSPGADTIVIRRWNQSREYYFTLFLK